MTLQTTRPALPPVPPPDPDSYGWGMTHLTAWREEARTLEVWAIEDAHAAAKDALARDAELVEARTQRNRRIRHAVALDAPTIDIPIVPADRGEAPDQDNQPRGQHAAPEPPTALERAKLYYWSRLDAGENPTADEVAAAVNCSRGYIKRGKHLDPWRAEWEANR